MLISFISFSNFSSNFIVDFNNAAVLEPTCEMKLIPFQVTGFMTLSISNISLSDSNSWLN